jgi:dTDP-4-amino-4,6-dideoxygalactose transaminase
MIVTNDVALAHRLRQLRSHGTTRVADEMENKPEGAWYYEQQSLGYNFRMTDVQAALGVSQLQRLDSLSARRVELANRYDESLEALPLILPARLKDRVSAWHLYAIEIDETRTEETRSHVFDHLRSAQIGVNVHYMPIHTQPFYRKLGFKLGDFPASEHYYRRAISIPLFPEMTEAQQGRVIAELRNVLRR